MRLRALFGAALAAVLLLAVLPSAATPDRPRAVRVDGSSSDQAESAAGCPSGTVALDSVGGHLYKYCGQYWPLNKLPIRIHVNRSQSPGNVSGSFAQNVNLAVQTWDALAPITGTGPRPSGCANARVICVATISDGPGTPSEIDVGWQPRGEFGLPGIAHVSPVSGGPITDVKITLNPDLAWFDTAAAGNVTTGMGAGLAGGIGCGPVPALCPWTFDLLGILVHELGHAIGLEDLNPDDGNPECDNNSPCGGWPQDLNDGPDYTQVMYAFYYPGSSTKRVPREGDIAGLYRVLSDSIAD